MPALRTCYGKKVWNVGSDDFVLPAFIAVAIRLVTLSLTTVAVLLLYLKHGNCEREEDETVTRIPPLLYGSLFTILVLTVVAIFNETILLSISCRGTIHYTWPRRRFHFFFYFRIVFFFIEYTGVIVSMIATVRFLRGELHCEDGSPAIYFVLACTIILLAVLSLYALGFLLYFDPCGCCTPGLLQEMSFLDKMDETDEELEMSGPFHAHLDRSKRSRRVIRSDPRKGGGEHNRIRLHNNRIGHKKILRRLQAVCCCLGLGGQRSRGVALEEVAKALHSLFGDIDIVLSDIIVGMVLLSHNQRKARQNCDCGENTCLCISTGLRDLTFNSMPRTQIPSGYERKKIMNFNFDDIQEGVLFEDLVHYMQYAMGMYGWPMAVFDDLCCGLCRLCAVTRCRARCCHKNSGDDFVKDNCCLCGVGSIRLATKIKEENVIFVTYENEIFQAPFSVCLDHKMKSVVVTVRGTLSIKDALTDFTLSLKKIQIPDCPYKETYVHHGMYRTAWWIKQRMEKNSILVNLFEEYWDYRLVVTGHSLGAGVASILAILLRPLYPDLVCYAFSPPGCIFSFPLALHSREFTTSVVVGNDMIPRISFRAMLHLKRELTLLLEKSKKPKHQILFQPRCCDKLFCCQHTEDPSVTMDDIKAHVEPHLKEALQEDSVQDTVTNLIRAKIVVDRWKRFTRTGSLHQYVEDIHSTQKIASFPPGNIVYIESEKNKTCCLGMFLPNKMRVTRVNSEDLCVILADKGMMDDHLPNNVLKALKQSRQQLLSGMLSSEETAQRRKEIQSELTERRRNKKVNDMSEIHVHLEEAASTKQFHAVNFWDTCNLITGEEEKDECAIELEEY